VCGKVGSEKAKEDGWNTFEQVGAGFSNLKFSLYDPRAPLLAAHQSYLNSMGLSSVFPPNLFSTSVTVAVTNSFDPHSQNHVHPPTLDWYKIRPCND